MSPAYGAPAEGMRRGRRDILRAPTRRSNPRPGTPLAGLFAALLLALAAFPAAAQEIPAAPGHLAEDGESDGGCALVWEPPPGAPVDGYILFIDRTNQGLFYEFTRTKAPSFRVNGLPNGATVAFKVAAFRDQLVSPMSEPVTVTPSDITAPETPKGLAAFPDRREIALKWRPVATPDFLHYTVYRKVENEAKFSPLEEDTGLLEPGYVDRVVRPGVNYYYQVTAFDKAGNESERSEAVVGRTLAIAHLSFTLLDRKLHAYCYNPNDRTLFYAYAYEENLDKWSPWRRLSFRVPGPDGVGEELRIFSVTRAGEAGVGYAYYPARAELYACQVLGEEKFGPWTLFAAKNRALEPPLNATAFEVKTLCGSVQTVFYDLLARRLSTRASRNGAEFDPPRAFPERIPTFAGETDEVRFSLVGLEPTAADLIALVPGTRTLYRVKTFNSGSAPVEFAEVAREFKVPPNFN